MPTVHITINDKNLTVESGLTILQAARENGIEIPTLCHFEGLPDKANCRICMVEIEGMRAYQPACATRVSEGMVIHTDSDGVRAARKTTLELLLANHSVDCHHCLRIGSTKEPDLDPRFCEMCFWCDCERDGFCELQTLARAYHVDVLPYIQHDKDHELDLSLGSVVRNPNKCIKCRRCVEVCGEVQTVHNLSMANRGRATMVVPELGKLMADSACVRCGRCVEVCPTGAVFMQEHKDEVLYYAHSYDHDTVVQLSANVIPELTALYKVGPGEITLKKVCAALHKLGFQTVMSSEHAEKLAADEMADTIERNVENGPVIVSNSFAVKNFVKKFFPDMEAQIYFCKGSEKQFAKYVKRLEGDKPVKSVLITNVLEQAAEAKEEADIDFVLNARELYRLFLRTGGAPARKYEEELDKAWEDPPIRYEELLGEADWNFGEEPEEVTVTVNGKKRKCAIAHNLGQVRLLLEGGYTKYDVVRLMA